MCGELVTRGEVDGRLKAERGDKELGITVEMEEINSKLGLKSGMLENQIVESACAAILSPCYCRLIIEKF